MRKKTIAPPKVVIGMPVPGEVWTRLDARPDSRQGWVQIKSVHDGRVTYKWMNGRVSTKSIILFWASFKAPYFKGVSKH